MLNNSFVAQRGFFAESPAGKGPKLDLRITQELTEVVRSTLQGFFEHLEKIPLNSNNGYHSDLLNGLAEGLNKLDPIATPAQSCQVR